MCASRFVRGLYFIQFHEDPLGAVRELQVSSRVYEISGSYWFRALK